MEIYKLGQILNLEKGKSKYNAKYVSQNIGIYNLYSSKTKDQGIFGKINSYDFNGEYILITTHGAYAGTVKYVNEKFSTTSNCFILKVDENIAKTKFLSYLLLLQEKTFNDMAIGSAYGYLKNYNINDFEVNLPNLKTQSAIIKIIEPLEKQINAFDELILSEQKSLQHYLNYFFGKFYQIEPSLFHDYKLEKIAKIRRGKIINSFDLKENPGDYPVISSNTKNNGIFGYLNSYMYDGEYITISADGAYAGTVFLNNGKFSITNVCFILLLNDKVNLLTKFLFYYLKKNENIIQKKSIVGSSRPSVREYTLSEIAIKIPSLEIQSAILGINEHFHYV
ncbi:RESTRICTION MODIFICATION ENZYME SUBUNIT S2B [Mycoplasmopsis pulmonis]|uniref:RESTRICTION MODIFICATION ENZYME SUBUNIT S2B n=1 Tax=Mycoplasmopsis pulmonis (strain UAB CTIP) TaxID=272635 RepID=Q98QD2_MYCPU|nr:restriction endonuclease subunit S [Mycoplasmopsis pulmonis]CAC13607.1 RESTRICTION MODIFICATION ENZYME SUBUNIT S2B [Mycoplasmopsis pulmonis]